MKTLQNVILLMAALAMNVESISSLSTRLPAKAQVQMKARLPATFNKNQKPNAESLQSAPTFSRQQSLTAAARSSPLFSSSAAGIRTSSTWITPLKRRLLTFRGGSAGVAAVTSLAKRFLDDVAASKSKSWAVLFGAILLETFASTLSKRARDTANPALFAFAISLNLVSLCGFCTCLARLDVGVAYAVWAALGTVIVTTAGIFMFGEAASPIKLASIILVILGVIGLNLADAH